MNTNQPTSSSENLAQHEMFETAQRRIKKKKRLYFHFIIFTLASIFMFVINKVLDYGVEYDWYLWAILGWGFIFILHAINVFITDRFLGRAWERKQRDRLVALQEKKMVRMQIQIEKEYAAMTEKIAKEEAKKQAQNPSAVPPASHPNTDHLGTNDTRI